MLANSGQSPRSSARWPVQKASALGSTCPSTSGGLVQIYRLVEPVLEQSQDSVAAIKPVKLWKTEMASNDVHQKVTGPVPSNVRVCRVGQGTGKHQIWTDDACSAGDSTLSKLMLCGLIPVPV